MAETGFAPTHTIPEEGLDAWAAPDPSTAAVARLEPRLEVQVLEQRDDGWAQIRCSNGWEAWTDGRRIVPNGGAARDELVSSLLGSLQDAVASYKALMDAFEAGKIDEASMRRKALGIGLVVRDDEAWILDIVNQKWHRFDGFQVHSMDLVPEV